MKIASSSASFASELANGALTQLEWLDLCASELELDGVVLDARHFPRTDGEYLAQLKKTATDLGLTVAALAALDLLRPDAVFDQAIALGAPLVVVDAAPFSEDAEAWDAFIGVLKPLAATAKERNVTLALRNGLGTLCSTVADCKRAAKDVDSAWLRFALDAATLSALDATDAVILKTVLATHALGDVATFATTTDEEATRLLERLRGFRGFLCLDGNGIDGGPRDAFHQAVLRFQRLLARQALSARDR